VDRALRELGETGLPRSAVVAVVRGELSAIREAYAGERDNVHPPAGSADPMERIRAAVERVRRSRLGEVINGTGIIVHTNFGRSPLAREAAGAVARVAENYSNLEYDLAAGERGGRAAYVERLLALLCSDAAECAATIVNNCAAALLLTLHHLTKARPGRNEVVVSRGALEQIGGGFRIPEVLEASGARLREVGTTNRTSLEDYARAMTPAVAMILKVHRSNFYMDGFVSSPSTAELAGLAREHGVPLVEDLGSGAVFDTTTLGGEEREPTPREALAAGADLVTFSGDKLLGGPQAGIVAGRPELVAALKRDPMFRALRCDKLVLAGLEATAELHLSGRTEEIPIFAMMRVSVEELEARAHVMAARLAGVEVGRGEAQVGGGTLPRTKIASVTLDVRPVGVSSDELARRLRLREPAVVGYISADQFRLDLRTIFPAQDARVVEAIEEALRPNS
jgi:L-seryl-tRNA(Ser) seleniumtransferase